MRAVAAAAVLAASACSLWGCGDDGGGSQAAGGLRAGGLDDATTPDAPEPGAVERTVTRFDGSQTTLAAYKGKPLVVNFFATWCVPCVKEMPDIEAAHRQLGDRVAFVGANVSDQLADGKALAAKTGVTYDLVRDPSQELLLAFGGVAMPTTAFVDPAGKIVKVESGKTFSTDELLHQIDELF
jgi:thiol-disulfide isomerase/thioredoxin